MLWFVLVAWLFVFAVDVDGGGRGLDIVVCVSRLLHLLLFEFVAIVVDACCTHC